MIGWTDGSRHCSCFSPAAASSWTTTLNSTHHVHVHSQQGSHQHEQNHPQHNHECRRHVFFFRLSLSLSLFTLFTPSRPLSPSRRTARVRCSLSLTLLRAHHPHNSNLHTRRSVLAPSYRTLLNRWSTAKCSRYTSSPRARPVECSSPSFAFLGATGYEYCTSYLT